MSQPYKRIYRVITNNGINDKFNDNEYKEALTRYHQLKHECAGVKLYEHVFNTVSDYISFNGNKNCLLS